MTTQAQAVTVQAQAMTAQANRDVAPRVHEKTIASRLRDFTLANLFILYGSKVDEDPQELIDEVSVIIFAMGFSTS